MSPDAVTTARLRAYELMEAAQAEDHLGVRDELVALEGQALREGWEEVAQLAATGSVLYDLVHDADPRVVEYGVADLLNRALALEDVPALRAAAYALRGISAGLVHDSSSLLADTGRAIALVAADDVPPMDRCFVLVLCAAAYNAVNLWELADELYDRASALAPACLEPIQQSAVVVNRFLIRLEWAAALFEVGEEADARAQVRRAGTAVRAALRTPGLPRLWRLDASACRHLLDFVKVSLGDSGPDDADVMGRLARLDSLRSDLQQAGDVEVLPLLEGFVALGLLRLGRVEEARLRLGDTTADSSSSGAHSFRAWVRAEASAPAVPDQALTASREYGTLVARLRWGARTGVLAAARARIADEQLAAEHAILTRDVLLDPLTGLLNRRSFDHWQVAVPAEVKPTALLLIDVDAFKLVNDLHGHAVGDEALRRIARLVADNVRAGDTALRLGGDEFTVILTSANPAGNEKALRRVANRRAQAIRSAVGAVAWDEVSPGLAISVSIGIAVGSLGPGRPGAADELYRLADEDLYEAKFRRSVPAPPRDAS